MKVKYGPIFYSTQIQQEINFLGGYFFDNMSMLALQSILKILQDEIPFIRREFFVKRLGIFGSYARNEETPKSDLDVLVEFSKPVGFILFMNLEEYLSQKLQIKVDLVTPNAIKPQMRDISEDLIYV